MQVPVLRNLEDVHFALIVAAELAPKLLKDALELSLTVAP